MKRVTMVSALVLTGFLLQACPWLGIADPDETARQQAAERAKQEAAHRAEEAAREQARRTYFEEVVVPSKEGYGPGEYRDYVGDVDDYDPSDRAWQVEQQTKFTAWRTERGEINTPAGWKAEEEYYDAQVLGTGKFPSLEAYREAKKKDPALRAAERAKQATWERKKAAKKTPTPPAGEGGGGGGGGGAGGGEG